MSTLSKIEFPDKYPKEMLVDIIDAAADTDFRKLTKFGKTKMERYYLDEETLNRR